MLRLLIVFSALLPLTVARGAAQEAPLTLAEVHDLARERNPLLRAAQAAADAVAARQPAAVLPPDPQLQLGVMNASLPDLRTDMPGAMLPSIQAMQMIPVPGKLRLEGEIARQGTTMARAQAEEVWWEIRNLTAVAFYDIYEADRQLEVLSETLVWLRYLEEVATSVYSVGAGRQSDVLRAGVEIARMQAELARLSATRAAAAARLNALLERSPDVPVRVVAGPALPVGLPAFEELRSWADEGRPMLARGRSGLEQARAREHLARREIWPDLTVGVQYGQRPSAVGTERMGSLMLGVSVPVFAGRRQLQMRREATAMREMASADLAQMQAVVGARIAEVRADLESARTLITLFRTEVLPQAEANVASALASYQAGRVDFMTLLDAQMTLNEYRQELHSLRAESGRLVSELEMTIGRELPGGAALLEEET